MTKDRKQVIPKCQLFQWCFDRSSLTSSPQGKTRDRETAFYDRNYSEISCLKDEKVICYLQQGTHAITHLYGTHREFWTIISQLRTNWGRKTRTVAKSGMGTWGWGSGKACLGTWEVGTHGNVRLGMWRTVSSSAETQKKKLNRKIFCTEWRLKQKVGRKIQNCKLLQNTMNVDEEIPHTGNKLLTEDNNHSMLLVSCNLF